jgi:hypothetical protein
LAYITQRDSLLNGPEIWVAEAASECMKKAVDSELKRPWHPAHHCRIAADNVLRRCCATISTSTAIGWEAADEIELPGMGI